MSVALIGDNSLTVAELDSVCTVEVLLRAVFTASAETATLPNADVDNPTISKVVFIKLEFMIFAS